MASLGRDPVLYGSVRVGPVDDADPDADGASVQSGALVVALEIPSIPITPELTETGFMAVASGR
jgi:hypothetical protein